MPIDASSRLPGRCIRRRRDSDLDPDPDLTELLLDDLLYLLADAELKARSAGVRCSRSRSRFVSMNNKILIVDDDPFNLDLLEQELTERGYTIDRAGDGEEALRRVETFQPDVVLLDYMMPKMNGIEVTKRLKGDDRLQNVADHLAHGQRVARRQGPGS